MGPRAPDLTGEASHQQEHQFFERTVRPNPTLTWYIICLPSTKLGADISIGSMKKLLGQIGDLLNTFDYFFTGVEGGYQPPAIYGDANDLIGHLKLAIETENRIQNERLKAAGEASAK